ncbi:MAG: ribosome silencing factor [Bacteroidales bacterium]
MIKTKEPDKALLLVDAIVQGIQERKGLEIVSLNLGKINSTICDYFVICHGTSNTHVQAIGESIEEEVKKRTGTNAQRREGFGNAEWVLLDFLDVVVHVFQEPVRNFYNLESLWADAPLTRYEE